MEDYISKKTAKLVSLIKEEAPTDGGEITTRYLLKSKQYNRDTGRQLEDLREEEVSVEELEKVKAHLLKEIEGIDLLMADIKKL